MRDFIYRRISTFFLTLVVASLFSHEFSLGTAQAASSTRTEIAPIHLDTSPIDGLAWPHDRSPYNYSLYGGFTDGNFFEADQTLATTALGFRFSYDVNSEQAWDYNTEVNTSENLIGLHFGRRKFFPSLTELSPYYKLAVGTHLRGSDGLANFVEIRRWQARASIGIADVFSFRQHLYLEMGLGAAVVGAEYFAVLGLNFNI